MSMYARRPGEDWREIEGEAIGPVEIKDERPVLSTWGRVAEISVPIKYLPLPRKIHRQTIGDSVGHGSANADQYLQLAAEPAPISPADAKQALARGFKRSRKG